MHVAVIYPPFDYINLPTSPPLALACLNASMKREGIACRICDWNVDLTDHLLEPGTIKELGWDGSFNIGEHLSCTFRDDLGMFLDQGNYLRSQMMLKLASNLSKPEFRSVKQAFLSESVKRLMKRNPDVVGISVQERQHHSADLISKTIKAINPGTVIVLGGYNPTLLTEDYVTLEYADAVVVGEGEEAIVEIAKRAEAGNRDFDGVANVAYTDHMGRPRFNQIRLIANLEDLPFPEYEGLPLAKYFSPSLTFPVLCSRGCWWARCAFCSHHKSYCRPYRARPVDHVISEIRELQDRYGCHHVIFNDEAIETQYARQLSERLCQESISIVWSAYFRFQKNMNKSFADTLQKSGCRVAMWGLESGNQGILDKMDKGIELTITSRLLRLFHLSGIMNVVFCFIGFPGETTLDALDTVSFLQKHKRYITKVGCCSFELHHGSRIWENPESFGVRLADRKAFHRAYTYADLNDTIPREKARQMVRILDESGSFAVTNDLRAHLLVYARHGWDMAKSGVASRGAAMAWKHQRMTAQETRPSPSASLGTSPSHKT